jgi:protein TonB
MQRPAHVIATAKAERMSPQKLAAIAGVGLLHVVFVWALVTGMAQKIVKAIPHEMQVDLVATPVQPEAPSLPKLVQPSPSDVPNVPAPMIDIQPTQQVAPITTTTGPSQAQPSDSAATGVLNTHTTPPYPDVARRLGEQGQVLLHLTISAQGDVTAATVTQSSGFPDLDQTAVAWVVAHWKYKPAIQNGAALASVTDAIVKFDLKNAR